MRPEEFKYELPPELIAQYPLEKRDSSRLMVLKRTGAGGAGGAGVEHATFPDIKKYLRGGDLLVLNDTRVIPARLMGRKPTGGRVEVFLVRKRAGGGGGGEEKVKHGSQPQSWECLVRPSKGLETGTEIEFNGGPSSKGLFARLGERGPEGVWTCELTAKGSGGAGGRGGVDEAIEATGRMPLPPYIKREAEELDRTRYQTVFAKNEGAVAAPTAGLHFTPELIEVIKAMGVDVCYITLHTGPATFMPVRTEDIKEHRVPSERFSMEPAVVEAVRSAKREGRRVVAVGSTVTRALETALMDSVPASPSVGGEAETRLFIYPPFEFKAVDALLTNFHLPSSSLIMLVSAFAGRERVLEAYTEAVKERYRFYSYGDAMLIV